jgi:hypothetical protein
MMTMLFLIPSSSPQMQVESVTQHSLRLGFIHTTESVAAWSTVSVRKLARR